MPKQRPSVTYIPPTHVTSIACPRCRAKARLISRSPLVSGEKGEMRTFRCKTCGEDTKFVVKGSYAKLFRW